MGERATKQGSKTALFKLTARTKLAVEIGPRDIDDLLGKLYEEASFAIPKVLSSQTADLAVPKARF